MMSMTPQMSNIRARGSRANQNVLNKALEGANTFISMSSTKQSNDKNVSLGDPTFSVSENTPSKFDGISTSNDNDTVSRWI